MKFYLIDDDKNVLHILKRIIRDRGLGEIAGTAENGVDALTDLPLTNAFPGCIQRYDRRRLFCGH